MLNTAIIEDQYSVTAHRHLKAPVETVFAAWTNPEMLAKWFGPKGFTIPEVQSDLRVGGAYKIAMQPPQGALFYHQGIYKEIDPPLKLSFTWELENQDCEGSAGLTCETIVTIELKPAHGGTDLYLTHDLLPTEAARDGHNMGWNSSLDCLEEFL